jgi:hypothetical protein
MPSRRGTQFAIAETAWQGEVWCLGRFAKEPVAVAKLVCKLNDHPALLLQGRTYGLRPVSTDPRILRKRIVSRRLGYGLRHHCRKEARL